MEIDLLENCYKITKVLRKFMIRRSFYRSKDSNVRLTQIIRMIILSTSTLSLFLATYQVSITSLWFKHVFTSKTWVEFIDMRLIYKHVKV
jgi:hypothetical protein